MRPSWPRVKLGEVCEIVAGQSPEGRYYTTDSSFMEFHQGSKNFCAWELEESGVYTRETTKVVDPGTLLISVRAPVGDLNVTPRRICIGRGLAGLLPNNSLDRDFLCQFLRAETKAVNDAAGAGSCFSSISRKQLASLEISLPPLAVQREIVARLERELGAVDKLAKKFEELETAAEAEFKAELKETFEGLGDVKQVKLGDVCEVKAGDSAPQDKALFIAGVYPFVRTSDVGAIHFGVLNESRDKLNEAGTQKLHLFKAGSILFPKSGASTFLNHRVLLDVDAYVASHLAVITPGGKVNSKYLLNLLAQVDAKDLMQDTSYPALRTSEIEDVEIDLPPLSIQRSIVSRLDAAKAKKEALVSAAKRGMETAALWRKAILKEAFE